MFPEAVICPQWVARKGSTNINVIASQCIFPLIKFGTQTGNNMLDALLPLQIVH